MIKTLKGWFKNSKVLLMVASAFVLLTAGAFMTGCKKVEAIDITKSNAPQVVYVQGSDLNLENGKLTVVIKGEKTEIPLTDEDVSISGYDKNKLGDQVLTITYDEHVTTLKVTVVPRVAVSKYESAYFVGESFNAEKGELLITNDDGTQFVKKMNDETVTVSGFNTETANSALALTATYDNGTVNYSGTFNVAVYEPTEVEFRSPNKKDYKNHETTLDVSGGYIAIKCDNLSRYAELTADMVTGFDVSQATLENRETPLKQTLTVTYMGQVKTYEIQIKYSDVSLINLRASEMQTLNWTSSDLPENCTEEMGENALEAMEVYFAMSEGDLKLLADGAVDPIVKVATAYGLDKWQKAFASYSDAIYQKEGSLYWNCENYEKTKLVYNKLLDKDPVLYEDAVILLEIADKFANLILYDEENVGAALAGVYTTETIDEFAGQLGLIVGLYETLSDIPDEWTLEMLNSKYSEAIHNAWVLLRETEYVGLRYRNIYGIVSRWRTNDDFFEILYAYYYSQEDFDSISAFKDMRLPGQLEELYSMLLTAKTEIEYMQNGYQPETTNSMYFYEKALRLKDEILSSSNEMEKDLYARLTFDGLFSNGNGGYSQVSFDSIFATLRRATLGYLYNFNAYLGIPEFEALWKDYVKVLDKTEDEAYMDSDEFATDAENLLKDYIALTPKQQFGFILLLNEYYGSGYPSMAWDASEIAYSRFVYFVYHHYNNVLPESVYEIFMELMKATEYAARSSLDYMAMDNFLLSMGTVSDKLALLSTEDKAVFENEFGWLYEKYEPLTDKFADTAEPVQEDLGEWEDDFDELLTAVEEAYFLLQVHLAFEQQGKATITLAYLAAFEKAQAIADRILASGDETILNAYYYDVKTEEALMPGNQIVTFGGTMDFLMFTLRDYYTNMLTGSLFISDLLLDYYAEVDMKEFMADSSYMFYNFVYMSVIGSSEEDPKFFEDADQVMSLVDTFRTLSVDQQYFFMALDSSYRMYHNGVARFAMETLKSADANAVVEQLLKVEFYYVFYQKLPDASSEDGITYKDILDDELQLLLEEYKLMQEAGGEAEFNTYFGAMYRYYIDKCAEIGLETTL